MQPTPLCCMGDEFQLPAIVAHTPIDAIYFYSMRRVLHFLIRLPAIAFAQGLSRIPKESCDSLAISGDPGCDDTAPDRGTSGTTTHLLIGGPGSLSDTRSRKWEYIEAEVDAGEPLVGTVLDTMSHGNDAVGWTYFQRVSPSQGEHIGSKYCFKVASVATNDDPPGSGTVDKNAYQSWVSYGNTGTPTGVTGVRSFGYSWCVAFMKLSRDFEVYPFVPEGAPGYVVYGNWDFDESAVEIDVAGHAFDKTNAEPEGTALTPGIYESQNNLEVANTSYLITAG
jgi:hypothetical protein